MATKKQKTPITTDSDIKLIRKANELVEARYKFDIWETRVFAYMLTLIKHNDTDFNEYTINTGDIVREFNLHDSGLVYDSIKKAADKLLDKKVEILRTTAEGKREYFKTHLVASTANPEEGAKENYIKLSFHPALKQFLLELKARYLVYDIRNILSLTSIYSVRLFELLKQYQKIGKRKFMLDELKELLSIESHEYQLYGHFKGLIKRAEKDLAKYTDIYFQFEEEVQKRKVVAVTFYIFENTKNQRLKVESVATSKATEKNVEVIPDNDEVEILFQKVEKYVTKQQVKKWVGEVPIDQIEKAITYTIHSLESGKKIENIGGFLNTMVYTPNLFDKYEAKKEKVKKVTKKATEQKSEISFLKEKIIILQQAYEKDLSELDKKYLLENPTLYQQIIDKIQANSFYDHKQTLESNLERDSIKGLRTAILLEIFPDYQRLMNRFNKEMTILYDRLTKLNGNH